MGETWSSIPSCCQREFLVFVLFTNKAHDLHSVRHTTPMKVNKGAWLNRITYRKARDLLGIIWGLELRASPLGIPD